MVGRGIGGRRIMDKKEYLVEITYVESENTEVITLKTDDLDLQFYESISKKSFTIDLGTT